LWLLGGIVCLALGLYGIGLGYWAFSDEGTGWMFLRGVGYMIGGWVGAVACFFHLSLLLFQM
jgi:hypothetical protein